MTAQPQPRYIARAIADLLADKAREAHSYLDAWTTLTQWTQMPLEHVQTVLDATPHTSQAMTVVNEWNGRGALKLCGPVGPGKTYAAAQWALSLARRDVSCCWINAAAWAQWTLDDQQRVIRRGRAAGGLIVDDVGSGATQGDWFHQQIEGLLLDRGHRPSIVIGNMNELEMRTWLKARLLDRDKQVGALVVIEGRSLRRTVELEYDDQGHGERWRAATALVATLGVRKASSWNDARGIDEGRLDVGHVLEQDVEQRRRRAAMTTADARRSAEPDAMAKINADERRMTLEGCRALTRAHGLDPAKIIETAVRLEATDPATLLMPELERALGGLSQRQALVRINDTERKIADTQRLAGECYGTLNEQATRLRGEANVSTLNTGKAPAWTSTKDGHQKIKSLGYTSRELGGGRGFVIRKDDRMVIPEHPTEHDAWESLRRLLGAGW